MPVTRNTRFGREAMIQEAPLPCPRFRRRMDARVSAALHNRTRTP